MNQLMRKRDHSDVTFVTTASPKRVTWKNILNQYMRKRNIQDLWLQLPSKEYIAWKVMLNQCDICEHNCSKKCSLKTHHEMIHEKMKPFNCYVTIFLTKIIDWKTCWISSWEKVTIQMWHLSLQLLPKELLEKTYWVCS